MVEASNILKELEKAIADKKILFGLNQALRAIKTGREVEKVIYSANTPEDIKEEIESYIKMKQIPFVKFDGTGKDLGALIKRGHAIMIITLVKK